MIKCSPVHFSGKTHGTESQQLELTFFVSKHARRNILLPEPAAEYVAEVLESKCKCVPGLLFKFFYLSFKI